MEGVRVAGSRRLVSTTGAARAFARSCHRRMELDFLVTLPEAHEYKEKTHDPPDRRP